MDFFFIEYTYRQYYWMTITCLVIHYLIYLPFEGTGSWDDTDEDEKTLRELRETFKTEKKKEQEAEELRIKLESQAEGRELPVVKLFWPNIVLFIYPWLF